MVLYAQPIADCLRAVQAQCAAQGRARPHVVFLTAAGRPYNEEKARELADYDAVTLVCATMRASTSASSMRSATRKFPSETMC